MKLENTIKENVRPLHSGRLIDWNANLTALQRKKVFENEARESKEFGEAETPDFKSAFEIFLSKAKEITSESGSLLLHSPEVIVDFVRELKLSSEYPSDQQVSLTLGFKFDKLGNGDDRPEPVTLKFNLSELANSKIQQDTKESVLEDFQIYNTLKKVLATKCYVDLNCDREEQVKFLADKMTRALDNKDQMLMVTSLTRKDLLSEMQQERLPILTVDLIRALRSFFDVKERGEALTVNESESFGVITGNPAGTNNKY